MNHVDLCVNKNQTVRDAMRQLSHTAKRILFVLDGSILIGTLTDGDVRRYLLNGGSMDDAAGAAAYRRSATAADRKQAERLLKKNKDRFYGIPIVGRDGKLLDIVLPTEPAELSLPSLQIPVVIMAGGRGTRLDPYTRILPKPLIPVGELPIIEHIMRQFEAYGCTEFHVIVNYKKQLLKAYFNESDQHYNVTWYDEDQPLGTGGGLYLLKGRMDRTFFFTNCDILLRSDYASMLKFHQVGGNVITMIGAYKSLTIPYGVVDIENGGDIKAMREKPELSFLTNAGMYIVEPEVLEDIQDGVPIGFPEIIEAQRTKGKKVSVYPVNELEWMDMGQLDELLRMKKELGEP